MTERMPTTFPHTPRDPVPQFDESRPHPYVDPLQANGTLTAFTPNAIARITVRNPIKRMRNGTRSGVIDWHATAEDLAKNLYATSAALAVSRELTDLKNEGIERRERRITTLEKQLENQRETIRNYRDQRGAQIKFALTLRDWWMWRWFAPVSLKKMWMQGF